MSEQCEFCRLFPQINPATVVLETEDVIAFLDPNQSNLGHVVVAPKRHMRDIYELDDPAACDMMIAVRRIARGVAKATEAPGLNLFHSSGDAAFQDIDHFHIHVVPRHWNDDIHIHWHRRTVGQDKLQEMAGRIREALSAQA